MAEFIGSHRGKCVLFFENKKFLFPNAKHDGTTL
jgi:hypothetical protein